MQRRRDGPSPGRYSSRSVSSAELLNLAVQHHNAGRLADAERLYRQILAADPNHYIAWQLLGTLACQTGHQSAGIDLFRRAIALKPDYADAYNNLSRALAELCRFEESLAAARRAIELAPRLAGAYNNLGVALDKLAHHDEALAAFQQALALDPSDLSATLNSGVLLNIHGKPDEAIACFRRVLAIHPDDFDANLNLGTALKSQARLDEALAAYRAANPSHPDAHQALSNIIYTMHFHAGSDAKSIRAELKRWNDAYAKPLPRFDHANHDRDANRKLKIGYVSPDFRDHVIGRNLIPLLREHDRTKFELFCYADVNAPDEVTAQFQNYVGANWRNVLGQPDDAVAKLVRQDRIDILIDCALHMAGNRLRVLARQPAPIQMTFAGAPASTGIETIQYRITAPLLEPPGIDNENFWAEKPLNLPDTWWCYEPGPGTPPVNDLPVKTNGYLTFGCLNNYCKINDPTLGLFARVMRQADRSRLILLSPEGSHRQHALDIFQQAGVGPDRITFHAHLPRNRYLQTYQQIDIGLDSFPTNGHTTSLDAFWMGVPVVTRVGELSVGRAGALQLTYVDLPELIAHSEDEFAATVAQLASDQPRLSQIRASLRGRMQNSPMTNAPAFARAVESVLQTAWQRQNQS